MVSTRIKVYNDKCSFTIIKDTLTAPPELLSTGKQGTLMLKPPNLPNSYKYNVVCV